MNNQQLTILLAVACTIGAVATGDGLLNFLAVVFWLFWVGSL